MALEIEGSNPSVHPILHPGRTSMSPKATLRAPLDISQRSLCLSDERPAEDAAPEPDQPAPQPAPGDPPSESGYAYTVVDATRAAPAPKVKRESTPARVGKPLLAALIIVPAVVAGVAAWFIASSLQSLQSAT